MPTQKHPFLALVLSLIMPGLGQLYNGERATGLSLLVMVMGMGVSCLVFRGVTTCVLMGVVYLAVVIPAAADAYQTASGRQSRFSGDAVWYVIAMLLAVGPFALPLLWTSPRFSRTAKITWTVIVVLVALLCIVTVAALGPALEQILRQPPILR